MAKPKNERLVQRTFWIDEASDKALDEWAEKIPDMGKSALARVWLVLGRDTFERSPILNDLMSGSLPFLVGRLRVEPAGSKKMARAKRRGSLS